MMKKTLLAVAALSILVACGSVPARAAGVKSEEGKAAAMSSMKGDAALQQKLATLERKAWEAFKSQDLKMMKEVVAEDALSADMNGFATMDHFESMMKDYLVESFTLRDWKLIRLGKEAAVLVYVVTVSAKYKDQPVPPGPYFASTTYLERGGKWVAVYHQETLAAPPLAGEKTGQG